MFNAFTQTYGQKVGQMSFQTDISSWDWYSLMIYTIQTKFKIKTQFILTSKYNHNLRCGSKFMKKQQKLVQFSITMFIYENPSSFHMLKKIF